MPVLKYGVQIQSGTTLLSLWPVCKQFSCVIMRQLGHPFRGVGHGEDDKISTCSRHFCTFHPHFRSCEPPWYSRLKLVRHDVLEVNGKSTAKDVIFLVSYEQKKRHNPSRIASNSRTQIMHTFIPSDQACDVSLNVLFLRQYHAYNRNTRLYHCSRQLFIKGHGSRNLSIIELT